MLLISAVVILWGGIYLHELWDKIDLCRLSSRSWQQAQENWERNYNMERDRNRELENRVQTLRTELREATDKVAELGYKLLAAQWEIADLESQQPKPLIQREFKFMSQTPIEL